MEMKKKMISIACKRHNANPRAVGANVLEPLLGTQKLHRRVMCGESCAGLRPSLPVSRLRIIVKKDAVTGVRQVAVGKQKKGSSGLEIDR